MCVRFFTRFKQQGDEHPRGSTTALFLRAEHLYAHEHARSPNWGCVAIVGLPVRLFGGKGSRKWGRIKAFVGVLFFEKKR